MLGQKRSWASNRVSACWASRRLIHDPTVTPQFPCLEDLWKFSCVMENGSNSQNMLTRTRGLVGFPSSLFFFFFFFFFFFRRVHLGGKIFEFPPKRFRDVWLARGDIRHLMRRSVWSRFGHVSKSEWSKGRLS
jgi:hypothetical protein